MPLDFDALSKAANAGFGIFIAMAGTFRWFVFGWAYDAEKARADKWEALCLEMMRETRIKAQHWESVGEK